MQADPRHRLESGLERGPRSKRLVQRGRVEQRRWTDKQRRELADLRNRADGLVYSTEADPGQEFSDNVEDEDDREELQKALGGDGARRYRARRIVGALRRRR